MRKSQFIFAILLIIINSCQFLPKKSKEPEKDNDGTRIIRSYYEKSGSLKSEITVKDNKKHGPAKKFYPTGELHTLVYYNNGIKEGETIWYYKTGQAYRVTPYESGKMHGIRKKYYKNGKIQAEIPYNNGELIEGTKEYKQNGELINTNTHIVFETIDLLKYEDKFILKMNLSKKKQKVKFFEEKTSTTGTKMLVPIKTNLSGTAKLEFYLLPGHFKMAILKIYVKYDTKLGNPVLKSRSYNLAIENRY